MKRRWQMLIVAAYALFMFWLLFGKRLIEPMDVGLQLKPLHTLRIYWRALLHSQNELLRWQSFANLFGNVLLFVPLGYIPPLLHGFWRRFWRQLLLMAALIILVEVTQLATGLGWCDIDDLLLNLLGTSLGYCLWKWVASKKK